MVAVDRVQHSGAPFRAGGHELITVLLATTGRPVMAETTIRSAIATTQGHRIEICAGVDQSPETVYRLDRACGTHTRLLVDHSHTLRGPVDAWNAAYQHATGDQVVLAADDLVFRPGWLDAALHDLHRFPGGWGMVGFNDGHMGQELSTHFLMSRKLIERVFDGLPALPYPETDTDANKRARLACRYTWCAQAHVDHIHWRYGERPQDPVDRMNLERAGLC